MLALFIAVITFGGLLQTQTDSIHYQIKPIPTQDRTNLRISVQFKTNNTNPSKIGLPIDCFGTPEIHNSVTSFEDANGAIVKQGEKEAERIVQPATDGTVSLHYTLSFDPKVMDRYAYAPNTGKDYFHLAGCQWLLRIGDGNEKRQISVEIADAPKDWKLYTSISSDASKFQTVDSYENLASSVIGGGQQSYSFKVKQKPISVIVHGKFDIPNKEIFNAVERIVRLERKWFNDHEQQFYNVVIAPRGGVVSGYSPDNAFICFTKKDTTRDELNVLLAHELFHHWLPNKIRVKPEKKYYEVRFEWFSEGFTDYFARKILLDAKLLTPKKFAALVNKDLYNLADNPHGRESYSELVTAIKNGKFSTAHKKLSYYRGAVIALNWNSQIRSNQRNRDLSDFIRGLYRLAAKSGGEISEQVFFDFAASYGIDAKRDLEQFIMRGDSIQVAPDALGAKFKLVETEKPSFEIGFSLENTFRTNKISGIIENSAAYRAGLREGMELVRIQNSNRFSNAWYADKPLIVTVKVDGQERTFDFFPHGAPLKLSQFEWSKKR